MEKKSFERRFQPLFIFEIQNLEIYTLKVWSVLYLIVLFTKKTYIFTTSELTRILSKSTQATKRQAKREEKLLRRIEPRKILHFHVFGYFIS